MVSLFNGISTFVGNFMPKVSLLWYYLTNICDEGDICLYFPPDRTWQKVNDPKVDYSGDLGEVNVGHEPRLDYAGHRLTVQCGSDETSRTFTQTWVRTRMPDNSLNWTTRSSGPVLYLLVNGHCAPTTKEFILLSRVLTLKCT